MSRRLLRVLRASALALGAFLLSLATARADVHPNTAPGFPVEQSFHVGDVDSVNLFNGALTLTIPLGGQMLYVEPIYTQATGTSGFPIMRDVIAIYGNSGTPAFKTTLPAALKAALGPAINGDTGQTG